MAPDKALRQLLTKHGVTETSAQPSAAWEAFKAFGRERFKTSGTGLLFQVGAYDLTTPHRFYFDAACQFEVLDGDGDHDHFEQTHCELTCLMTDELQAIVGDLWSFEFSSADGFYSAVEELPEFQAAMRQPVYSLKIYHEEV